jgi:hypothetical protein
MRHAIKAIKLVFMCINIGIFHLSYLSHTPPQNGQWLRAEDSAHLSGVVDTLSTAFHRLYAVLAHWESGGHVSGMATDVFRDDVGNRLVFSFF